MHTYINQTSKRIFTSLIKKSIKVANKTEIEGLNYSICKSRIRIFKKSIKNIHL